MEIKHNDTTYKFHDSLTFREVQEILNDKRLRMTCKRDWWYRKSKFGIKFLNSIRKTEENIPELQYEDISEKDWKCKFMKVLRNYFPNITEHISISRNIMFLSTNKVPFPIENKYFIRYLLMRTMGELKYKDLEEMQYKDADMLYRYMLVETLILKYLKIEEEGSKIQEDKKGYAKYRGMTI